MMGGDSLGTNAHGTGHRHRDQKGCVGTLRPDAKRA